MAIKITYNKKEYQLEYTRESVKQMESTGFVIEEVTTKPATMIPALFYGAFMSKNKGIKRKLVDEIYDSLNDKIGLISALAEMYAETLQYLTEPSEDSEGNATWEVV